MIWPMLGATVCLGASVGVADGGRPGALGRSVLIDGDRHQLTAAAHQRRDGVPRFVAGREIPLVAAAVVGVVVAAGAAVVGVGQP